MAKTARRPGAYDHWDGAMKGFAALSTLLDNRFKLPFLPGRFGLDALLGLVPLVGDGLTAAMGLYALTVAHRTQVSAWGRIKMVWNIAVDFALGAVPLVGDLFDFAFHAHRKNLGILERHLERVAARPPLDAP
ncbi:MAG: DUF4112 domain-containing protein [Pseudomonadota bacterium]